MSVKGLPPLTFWNVETGFRNEKHGGFGLKHTFCNDETAGRNYHVLMQIAYTLWQVFDMGVLSRLSEGCRKSTQEMWAKMLFVAILVMVPAAISDLRLVTRIDIPEWLSLIDLANSSASNGTPTARNPSPPRHMVT